MLTSCSTALLHDWDVRSLLGEAGHRPSETSTGGSCRICPQLHSLVSLCDLRGCVAKVAQHSCWDCRGLWFEGRHRRICSFRVECLPIDTRAILESGSVCSLLGLGNALERHSAPTVPMHSKLVFHRLTTDVFRSSGALTTGAWCLHLQVA